MEAEICGLNILYYTIYYNILSYTILQSLTFPRTESLGRRDSLVEVDGIGVAVAGVCMDVGCHNWLFVS